MLSEHQDIDPDYPDGPIATRWVQPPALHGTQHYLDMTKRRGLWFGRCSCGWTYPGEYSQRQAPVRYMHLRHVATEKKGATA